MVKIDQERFRAELEEMKRLIASDPQVKARFDADGNGVIDGEEWENVRQVVRMRLEREAAEAEAAKAYLEQLDPEQAAELARMEAEMAGGAGDAQASDQGGAVGAVGAGGEGGEGGDEASSTDSEPSQPAGRDFSNLELAFDPREERARQDSIAQDIYDRELAARYNNVAPAQRRGVRIGEEGSLADRRVLVLEQIGGAKQLFGSMFRRAYLIRDADGGELGRVGQRQNEALQDLTDFRILRDPDLHFDVHDETTGERYTFHRATNFSENSIGVYTARGHSIADTSWSLSFLRRKYEVRSVREGISYYVRRRALRPWTYDVLDPFEEPIGTMQRGWSGLGFLTAGNLFRIEVDKEVHPDAMWGFLATALLADLDSEGSSRRSGLDFFNS